MLVRIAVFEGDEDEIHMRPEIVIVLLDGRGVDVKVLQLGEGEERWGDDDIDA